MATRQPVFRLRVVVVAVALTLGLLSPSQALTLGPNFKSTFTTNARGWTPVSGTWTRSGGELHTAGLVGRMVQTQRSAMYSNFVYTVRAKATGVSPGYIIFRSALASPSDAFPHAAYAIGWSGNEASMFAMNAAGDAATGLMTQRIVPSMVAGGYNTFRVTAIGGVISIAINGVDVFAVVDNTYSVGRVGVGMYSFGSGELFVDSVKLKKIPASLLNRTAQRPGVIYSTGTPVENPKIKLVP